MSENSWLPQLLADLRSRGVTFVLKGNALKVRPWSTLTKDEAATVQANRPALKDLVRAEKAETPVPPPEPTCPYCQRVCISASHPEYRVLHFMDPLEIKKRNEAATRVMYMTLGAPGRTYGF